MNKNVPNILTIVRIVLTPIIIALFLAPIPNGIGIFVALGLYVLGCLTDFLDGYIARKYNLISDFGKFMDQIADKFITTTAMILVLFTGLIKPIWLATAMLLIVVLRDILVSGIRMFAASKGIVIAADIFGKIKSFFLDIGSMILMFYIGLYSLLGGELSKLGAMPIAYVNYFGLALMIIGSVLALVSCINYSINAVKALKEIKTSKEEK